MVDVFNECKERVTALDAAERYGLEVRRNWAVCVFHPDRKPSLHFHGGRYKCFSCGAAGTSIDFTSAYFGISPIDACKKLNEDFSLGLIFGMPATPEAKAEAQKRKEEQNAHRHFEEWRRKTVNDLNHCHRIGYRAQPPFTEGDVIALKNKDYCAYLADILADGSPDEQMSVFRRKGDVERLTRQILSYSQTR